MSDSDNDDNLPSAQECDRRCGEFAQITGTDSALAMFYLQDRDWDLQRSLDAYFGESSSQANPSGRKHSGVKDETKGSTASTTALGNRQLTEDPEPNRIRLLSWNIDGLDMNKLTLRTTEVANTIIKEKPDVVYLQEVVPTTLRLLEEQCPQYFFIPGGHDDYFTAILLHCQSTVLVEHSVTPFRTSRMGRNLLTVQAKVKGVPCQLMTSHLESTKDHGKERKFQWRSALSEMAKASSKDSVIFGGDLNIRDKEIAELGGVPEGILDLWEVTGKRPEAKFTWDTSRNDNLEMPGNFKPKLRFDRLYMRHPSGGPAMKPVYFELVGLERAGSCQRFPSDHWGILAHFDKA